MKHAVLGLTIALCLFAVIPASAGTIDWVNWTASTNGNPGSASGTAGSTGVTYLGEVDNLFHGYPSWGPVGTFNGGTISNAPPSANGIVQLSGGGTIVDTITFATPVTNPVMAIWSLGQGGVNARFDFPGTQPFTIQSGGPSNEYGGSSIFTVGCTVSDAVCGIEGNGTIQFNGTFSSLTWTNPVYEYWYGFTVGVPQSTATPEPASMLLLISGLGGLGLLRFRRN